MSSEISKSNISRTKLNAEVSKVIDRLRSFLQNNGYRFDQVNVNAEALSDFKQFLIDIGFTPARAKPWLQNNANALRALDPFDHLITAGTRTVDPLIWTLPEFDIAQVQLYQNLPDDDTGDQVTRTLDVIGAALARVNKPVLLTEYSLKLCSSCGYGHMISSGPGPDTCASCSTAIRPVDEIRSMVRLQNVTVKSL